MSVSLQEVIEAGGYDLSTLEDSNWLLAQRKQFDELVEKAEALIQAQEDKESAKAEAEYSKRFPKEE